jgi:hypothetical protein
LSFEDFEIWVKRNKWTSIIMVVLFIIGTIFSITDQSSRLFGIVKNIIGYEEPILVEADGNGAMEKRLNLAKLEATKYKIPSSSSAVIKFISLPMLNYFHKTNAMTDANLTHAMITTVSPIKPTSSGQVFDGADCRFGLEASVFDKSKMKAKFEIVSLSCTDNEGYAYSIEPKHSIGYISEIGDPGVAFVKIVDNDGYLTINPEINYFAQLYEPIETIDKKGISFFGRF